MKLKIFMIKFVVFIMISSAFTMISSAEEEAENFTPLHRQLDFDWDTTDWLEQEPDTPVGTAYRLWEHHGGFWADAEKHPTDDDDDLLCWAATGSNMLEWTGWGFIGGMETGNTDDFFTYYQDHTNDKGSLIEYGLEWWFNGNLHCPEPFNWALEDVEGGDFWSEDYLWSDYVHSSWINTDIMANISSWLSSGYAIGLSIYPQTPPGGHAITCWGYNYDPAGTTPNEKYLGVWVSDSDSHKHLNDPDDVLRYYEVEYEDHGTADTSDDFWYMPNYGSNTGNGWKIAGLTGLEPFPGESRPTANAGLEKNENEGNTISFDAAGSTDDDSLTYRWDWNNDGTWDTGWLTSTTMSQTWNDDYSGEVRLEVFDQRLRDIDTTTVTINNVAPSISPVLTDVNENELSTLTVDVSDPGIEDTFKANIDWGDGIIEGPLNYPAGTTSFTKTHQYLDDDPSGSDSDQYTVTVTVTDDDDGSDTQTYDVTVSNVAPIITSFSISNPINENDIATLSGTFTDPGSLDTYTLQVNWGDSSSTESFSYPSGTTSFSENHQYLDDNPTGTISDDYIITVTLTDDDTGLCTASETITVNNVDPIASINTMTQPNQQFILPGQTLDFIGSYTDQGTLDTHTYTWNFGDSTTILNNILTPTYSYSVPGNYTVEFTVTDDDTGTNSDTYQVHVVDEFEALQDLDEYIQSLDDDLFKRKAENRKQSLHNMILAIHDMLVDMEYNGAINDLIHNIREKADGSIDDGDGNSHNDWIIDCTAQYHICMKIDDITTYLATL